MHKSIDGWVDACLRAICEVLWISGQGILKRAPGTSASSASLTATASWRRITSRVSFAVGHVFILAKNNLVPRAFSLAREKALGTRLGQGNARNVLDWTLCAEDKIKDRNVM